MRRYGYWLLVLGMMGLVGCENNAASLMIDGDKDHSISLLREQRWFWSDEVVQRIVVARYPECQRRFEIVPGKTQEARLEIYGIKPMIYAARQDKDWYVIGTEQCQVRKVAEAPASPPGPLIGTFLLSDKRLRFVPEPNGSKAQ